MSSMISQPPPSIQLGGGGGAPGAPSGPGGPPGGGGGTPGAPDSQAVKDALQRAIAALDEAKNLEGDDIDKARIAKLSAEIHAFIGDAQKMEDTLMGGGPAARVMRKNPGAPAPGGGAGPAA